MAPSKHPPADEATSEVSSTVDPKQRRRVRRAFQRFLAENKPKVLATSAGASQTSLIVKVELLAGAHFPRLVLYRYDPTSGELSEDFEAVTLVKGEKAHTGTVAVDSGGVYALYCEYEGPSKSGLDVSVFYPPVPPKVWPPDVGAKAAGRKFEAIGKPVAFFVRVPTEGKIK